MAFNNLISHANNLIRSHISSRFALFSAKEFLHCQETCFACFRPWISFCAIRWMQLQNNIRLFSLQLYQTSHLIESIPGHMKINRTWISLKFYEFWAFRFGLAQILSSIYRFKLFGLDHICVGSHLDHPVWPEFLSPLFLHFCQLEWR